MKPIRYFFFFIIAEEKNGGIAIHSFSLTGDFFPTMLDCIEYTQSKYPDRYQVSLVSISEMQESDYVIFSSKQP